MSDSDTIHVLHVDDEPDFTDMAATFLEREDERIVVKTATTASEGLEYLTNYDASCVVSDHDMPGQNGIEFLEAVREKYPDLPFILYTGKGSEEVASDAISAGVTDYLQKEGGTDQYKILANRVVNAAERYQIERDAQQTRTQMEAISQNSADAIVIIDAESRIRFANPAVEGHFGYSPSDLRDEPLTTIMPERYQDGHLTAINRYIETGERSLNWANVEFHGKHRNGAEIPLSVSFSEFQQDGEQRFIGILRDISERTRLEEELREREERFRQLAENIGEVVWMSDPEKQDVFYANPAYEDIWGRSVESLYDDPTQFLDAIHPEDRERVESALDLQETGKYDVEYRIIRPDGELRWIRDRAVPVRNDAGEVYRIVGIASDITERKKREQELHDEREFIEQSLDGLQDVFFVFSQDGELLRWNDRISEITGYTDEEIAEMGPADFFLKEHHERIITSVEEILETGSATVQADVLTKDGGRIPHELNGTRLTDAEGEIIGFAGTGRDITNRRACE